MAHEDHKRFTMTPKSILTHNFSNNLNISYLHLGTALIFYKSSKLILRKYEIFVPFRTKDEEKSFLLTFEYLCTLVTWLFTVYLFLENNGHILFVQSLFCWRIFVCDNFEIILTISKQQVAHSICKRHSSDYLFCFVSRFNE